MLYMRDDNVSRLEMLYNFYLWCELWRVRHRRAVGITAVDFIASGIRKKITHGFFRTTLTKRAFLFLVDFR